MCGDGDKVLLDSDEVQIGPALSGLASLVATAVCLHGTIEE